MRDNITFHKWISKSSRITLTVHIPKSQIRAAIDSLSNEQNDDFLVSVLQAAAREVNFTTMQSYPHPEFHKFSISIEEARDMAQWMLRHIEQT